MMVLTGCIVESVESGQVASRCGALRCVAKEEGVNVSKWGGSVQPQPSPVMRLGKIRLAKLGL